MKLFAKKYFCAMLCVLLALAAYQIVVVPAIEPLVRREPQIPEYSPIVGGQRWWEGFFSDGDWQNGNPTIVQNGRGVLLASSWEQIGPKTWKLEPLSMILPQTDKEAKATLGSQGFAQQDVWIVSAQRGAIIHFDEPFDLRSGSAPSIERGQLDGEITITRRSISKPTAKPWSLTTSDLSIDHRKISTQQAVSIQWDQSTVRGRDLSILLRRDILGGGPSDDDSSPWGPLDELEMIHVDEVNVALPNGGLWAGVDPSLLAVQAPVQNLPAKLEAFCGGRFTFDFKSSIASLTGGVQMNHLLGQLPPDVFMAHKITLRVGAQESQDIEQGAIAVGGIKIREIGALGIDSLQNFVGEQWVEVQSQTLGAAVRAKKLRVDFEQQRIELAGTLDQPGATQSIALLKYQDYEFRSPSIEYQAAPPDALGKTQHAGWMFAEGPGELNTLGRSQSGESQVRWQKSLKMLPTETPGEQWVELLGNTLLENKQQGFMTAERLQVWLKSMTEVSNNDVSNSNLNSTEPKSKLMPDRVLATGNTTLATADLKAHVGTLALQMVYAPSLPVDPTVNADELRLNDSKGNPMYSFVSPPQTATSQPSATGAAAVTVDSPTKRGKPITVHGQSLTTTVVSAGAQSWIDSLTIDGPLTITSADEQSLTPGPWHIEGKQLLMASNAAGQVDLQINGEPAKIVMADGALEGPTIRFDQINNLIWMDQPGEFTVPPSVINRDQKQASGLQWVRPPHCQWQGRLVFDGSVARIDGDIEFDGVARRLDELWLLKGYCQRLDLALSESIDLRQSSAKTGASQTDPTVERIILQDNVDVRVQQLDLEGHHKSLERIVVPILTFHVQEQKVVGGGAGWINSKFLSQGKRVGQLASQQNSQEKQSTLQGAHLAFRDSLVAFLDRNEVVFDGKVGLAVGPLANWDETINPEKITQLQLEQMLLNCDQLKIVDTSELSTTIGFTSGSSSQAMEFQATGNVAFEGKANSGNYSGNGYQVTYVQVKDQLILRGDGQTPALIKKIPNNPQVESTWSNYVNEATINVKTLGVTNLQLSQSVMEFPQASKPGGTSNIPIPEQPNPRAGVSKFFQPQP